MAISIVHRGDSNPLGAFLCNSPARGARRFSPFAAAHRTASRMTRAPVGCSGGIYGALSMRCPAEAGDASENLSQSLGVLWDCSAPRLMAFRKRFRMR
jgi:hypothetical protein